MKIIFSPTKQFNLKNKEDKDWNISKYTKDILDQYKSLDDKKLKKQLNINENILNDVKEYIEGFDKKTSYKALYMYNGLSFKNLDPINLNKKSIEYLEDNLLILSAFYGPIKPLENIKPYRLDFNSKLKIKEDNREKSLKLYWKNKYDEYFNDGGVILNLASNEFSDILDKKRYNMINFNFYEYDKKNDKLKSHSTISKKSRGLMLKYLAENLIKDINEIKKFNYDNFKYDESKSSDNEFVFIKSS